MSMKLYPAKVLAVLLGCIAVQIILHSTFTLLAASSGNDNYYGILPVFQMNAEMNIPTLFSSVNLLLSGLLLFIIGRLHKSVHQKYFAWMFLAAIFLGLGIDETATIHEKIGSVIQAIYSPTGYLTYAWVIPYGIFVIALLVLYSRFLLNLPRRIMWLFLVSGGVFVSGAIGMEMMSANINEFRGIMVARFEIQELIEETLEMTGIALFIYTLLSYIEMTFPEFSLSVGREISVTSTQENTGEKVVSDPHSTPRAAL